LAAGVLLSGWDGQVIFRPYVRVLGPLLKQRFCNIPANISTVKNLFLRNGNDWDNELLILSAQFVESPQFHYKGFDKAPSASKAKRHIKNANLDEYISITVTSLIPKKTTQGSCIWFQLLMMSDWIFTWKSSIKKTHDTLKKNYPGTNVITGNLKP
jgi:hypothetical protein